MIDMPSTMIIETDDETIETITRVRYFHPENYFGCDRIHMSHLMQITNHIDKNVRYECWLYAYYDDGKLGKIVSYVPKPDHLFYGLYMSDKTTKEFE